jgi:uncharacterized protein (TIGR02246 family)
MTIRSRWPILVGLVVALVACQAPAPEPEMTAAPAPDPAADRAAIEQLAGQFQTAFNAGDAAAVAATYAEGAVLMPPDQATVEGTAAIQAYFQGFFDANTATIELASNEIEVSGDWAYDRGTYTMTTTPKAGGDAATIYGKYLVLLARQADGTWKVSRDIDNHSPAPMPTAESTAAPAAESTAAAPPSGG